MNARVLEAIAAEQDELAQEEFEDFRRQLAVARAHTPGDARTMMMAHNLRDEVMARRDEDIDWAGEQLHFARADAQVMRGPAVPRNDDDGGEEYEFGGPPNRYRYTAPYHRYRNDRYHWRNVRRPPPYGRRRYYY